MIGIRGENQTEKMEKWQRNWKATKKKKQKKRNTLCWQQEFLTISSLYINLTYAYDSNSASRASVIRDKLFFQSGFESANG